MPYRPKDIYRGRRKFRVPLTILLFVLVFLVVGSVAMFFLLQRYMVYDADGATLQLPFGREDEAAPDGTGATPEPSFEPVQVQVVWEDPDFEDLDMGTWDDLKPVQGLFIPFDTVTNASSLATALTSAQGSGFNMAVLEMKSAGGRLAWPSTAETALAYRTDGTMDVTASIASLHEAGMTVAAQISCFSDSLLLQHNWSFALRDANDTVVATSDGNYWLDPYNPTIRTYLTDLARELAAMGFDEIILADLYHPVSDAGFLYAEQLPTEPDPVVAVCQTGRRIVDALEGTDTVVSARISADSLRNAQGAQTGQDIDIFWRMFARLYCPTAYDILASDKEQAVDKMNGGDADARFVPVVGLIPESGSKSYVIG